MPARGAIRPRVILLLAITCGFLLRGPAAPAPAVAAEPGDAPQAAERAVRALLEERRDVLRELADAHASYLKAYLWFDRDGAMRHPPRDLLAAELALAVKQDEKVAAYERHLKEMKRWREYMPKFPMAEAAVMRAEIELLRARKDAKAADPPEIRELVVKWRDLLREESKSKAWRAVDGQGSAAYADLSAQLLDAELDAATKHTERVAARQAHLDRLGENEKRMKALSEAGVAGTTRIHHWAARAERIHAEILLLSSGAAAPEDDRRIIGLVKDRHDLLVDVVAAAKDGLVGGASRWARAGHTPGAYLEYLQQLLDATLAVARTPAERLKAYQEHADRVKALEKSTKGPTEGGAPLWLVSDYLAPKAARLEAEVLLLRVKAAAKQ